MTKITLIAGMVIAMTACSSIKPGNEALDAAKDHYSTADRVKKHVDTHDEMTRKALKEARSRSNEGEIYGIEGGTTLNGDLSLRGKSIYEAGMAYGAQQSLRIKNEEIQSQLKHYESRLDYTFNFGLFIYDGVILSPAVEEMKEGQKQENDRKLVRRDVAFVIYDEARIVTTPPTFRNYLVRDFLPPKKVHPSLKPKNSKEEKSWRDGVEAGWLIGTEQAGDIFNDGMAKLVRDFDGRVTYRKLVSRKMIDPAALKVTQHGVTFNGRTMNVGEQILEISDPAQFKNYDSWRSAWQLEAGE